MNNDRKPLLSGGWRLKGGGGGVAAFGPAVPLKCHCILILPYAFAVEFDLHL